MDLELQKEGQDQKLIQPAQSALYQPAVALDFFKTGGKAERFAQGQTIHVEEGGHTGMTPEPSRMYLLLEGEVALSVRKKSIAAIGKGQIFGEMATISQLPHSATAVAQTDCEVISLDEQQFQAAAAKAPDFALMLMNIIIARLLETVATLTQGGALSDKDRWNRAAVFDARVLADLRRQFEDKAPVSHPAKKVIMKEGDKGMFAYLVLEGAVAISIEGKIVEKVGPGGIFGELALVNQKPRVATATADTECSLLQINRNELMELVKTKPAFALSLLRSLAHRLRFMLTKYK
jgi:CRP/FNR family transcriptional regulator, cyclic AMP receptor protein